MTSLEQLKQELVSQKNAIIAKGGTVTTTYQNPSPAEITTGINSIPILDMSDATATPSDVLKGKTYYATDSTLKTGTLEVLDDKTIELIFNNYYNPTLTTRQAYTLPEGTKATRNYYMYKNPSYLDFYFNSDIETIGNYSFADTKNFNFANFQTLTHLTTIGQYGFHLSSGEGIDLTDLPSCITTLNLRAFSGILTHNSSIKLSPSVTTYGDYCYSAEDSTKRIKIKEIDLSALSSDATLGIGTFYSLQVEGDFHAPEALTEIPNYFNYCGGYDTIYIDSHITKIGVNSFGNMAADTDDKSLIKRVVFTSATPPTVSSNAFGYPSRRQNTKFYVPDEAMDEYNAISTLSTHYTLLPLSQLE